MARLSKTTSTTKYAVLVGVGLVALLLGVVVISNEKGDQSLVERLDDMDQVSYQEYATGTVQSTSAALRAEIEYISRHYQALARYRRVDQMLIILHGRIAYLLLHSTDAEDARHHLSEAYEINQKVVNAGSGKSPSKQEFLGDLFDTIVKLDESTGSGWKTASGSDTNQAADLRRRFLGVAGNGPVPANGEHE